MLAMEGRIQGEMIDNKMGLGREAASLCTVLLFLAMHDRLFMIGLVHSSMALWLSSLFFSQAGCSAGRHVRVRERSQHHHNTSQHRGSRALDLIFHTVVVYSFFL